jgi:hypothetical protein
VSYKKGYETVSTKSAVHTLGIVIIQWWPWPGRIRSCVFRIEMFARSALDGANVIAGANSKPSLDLLSASNTCNYDEGKMEICART